MDVGGSDQESSLFQAFIVPSVGIENKNVNKINDPIKQANPPAQEVPKVDSHKNDQPQPSDVQCKRFEQFSRLPTGLRKYVAKDLIGTSLEDIDPFYKDKQTFIVVNRDKDLFRFSSSKALYVFRPNNVIRRVAAQLLTHPFWAVFMILIILINCVISMVPPENELFAVPWELIFLIIYLVEFGIKVVARGFALTKFTYLRDIWNWLDLILIIIAIRAICLDPGKAIYHSPQLSELRVLKICSLSLSLRRIINVYWQSLVKMRDLLLFILFLMFVVAVLCMIMYMGMLTQRCVDAPKNGDVWSSFINDRAAQQQYKSTDELNRACGNSSFAQNCSTSQICLQGIATNPNDGYTSFDTAWSSMFTVLRLLQRDYWEEILQYVTATAGLWHILLFIALIYYGSFQLCALLWTPIAIAYNYMKDEQWENDLLNDFNETQQHESLQAANGKIKPTGCFAKFQRFVFQIIYNPYVVLFVIICIILNTLFMALDHHDMNADLESILRDGNYFFVLVFVIEAILKLTALGPVEYFRDEWNTFDFIVTLLGVIELGLENVQGLSVLRSFRLLRPLRLVRIVPAFDLLMKRCLHLFTVLRNQTIIVCMFVYIFVVFGNRTFKNEEKDRRWNFKDMFHSFMLVFRAMCGEWVETLYDCLAVKNDLESSFIYFCALAFIGSFVIMHLFVALILTNDDSSVLSSSSSVTSGSTPSSANESHANQSTSKSSSSRKFNLHTFLKEKLLEPNIQKIYDANKPIKNDVETQLAVSDAPASATITLSSNPNDDKNHSQLDHHSDKKSAVAQSGVKDASPSSVVVVAPVAATEDEDEDDATINKWSKFRVKALKFNENTYFRYIVLIVIIIGSIAMKYAVEKSSPTLGGFAVELAFCIVMIIEFISKTISCGWKSYFKNIWCLIDLFNTIVPIVGLFTTNQTLLILKALRPISLVSRCSGLKIVATRIFSQMRLLLTTLVICAAFWLIFAIMGVQMFAGKFYRCVDNENKTLDPSFVANREVCVETKKYAWINAPVNFDNVIEAYLSLLQVASVKGWIQIIYDAVDSQLIDTQPLQDSNIYMFWYFVIFIILGAFISANLIAGILVRHTLSNGNLSDIFPSGTKKSSKRSSTTSNNPDIDDNLTATSKLVRFTTSEYFDQIAFVLCVAYIVVLACDQYSISEKTATIIHYLDFVFGILFIIETALRLHAMRRSFLLNLWNFYDAVTVILLIIELITIEFGSNAVSINMLRVIRVLRFHSVFVSYRLRIALRALGQSSRAAFKIGLFLALTIIVYALIGVAAFKGVQHVQPINEAISFNDFSGACVLLIQIATTAGWDGVYLVLIKNHAFHPFAAFAYLWSFLFICILTIVNLMLTIILSYYKMANDIEYEPKQLQTTDFNEFNAAWISLAPSDQPLFINKVQLPILLNRLSKTSTLRTNLTINDENIQLLGIPTHNDQQLYRGDVLIALNKNRLRHLSNAN